MSALATLKGLAASFEAACTGVSQHIAEWAYPTFDYDARITKGWPMTRLDQALYAVGVYLVIVAVGCARLPRGWKPSQEPKQKADWLTNFKNEPIRIFQALYNLVQVRHCRRRQPRTRVAVMSAALRALCRCCCACS